MEKSKKMEERSKETVEDHREERSDEEGDQVRRSYCFLEFVLFLSIRCYVPYSRK